MPSVLGSIPRNEKLIMLSLIRLNEEEKEKRLVRAVAKAISLVYGGNE